MNLAKGKVFKIASCSTLIGKAALNCVTQMGKCLLLLRHTLKVSKLGLTGERDDKFQSEAKK